MPAPMPMTQRVAAALSILFAALAVVVGSHALHTHDGWEGGSGRGAVITVMLLLLGYLVALAVVLRRPPP